MNIVVELNVYKLLVMRLVDEQDTLNKVIERMLEDTESSPAELPEPVNQRDPGFWYRGSWHRSKNAIDVYLEFLEILDRYIDNFYEKYARACKLLDSSRPYIAKEKEALYPQKPHLERYARSLGEWWVDGNISNRQKHELMCLASDTAGLREGIDYKFSIPNAR